MRTWAEYKETMHEDCAKLHDLARSGDVLAFSRLNLNQNEINRKNHKGYSPLMLAAYNGHAELTKFLIANGADLDSIDNAGNTILMGVAFKGYDEIVNLFLKHGADLNIKNNRNQTALDFAQMFARTKVVKILKAHQNQPGTYSFLDWIKSWKSVFKRKRESQ